MIYDIIILTNEVIKMIIKGLQKLTLLDFPTKVACTVFTGGCNFRCPFCHNGTLVSDPKQFPTIEIPDLLSFLDKRKGILDGVCITGGEPLLNKDIAELLREIKARGYGVKLDTNGSYPELLESLIDEGLVDYVAVDIKSSKEKYHLLAGTDKFNDNVSKTVSLLLSGKVDYEFRTTVVRELHELSDFEDIGKWITGAKRYYLQLFKDSGDLLGEGYSAYSEDDMRAALEIVKKYIPTAEIRGM